MRYRLMATYQGSPFEAGIGPTDGDIVLFAACPPPEELGFEPATGHWRKQLRVADVQAVWESRPVGTFRGERCMVLDDLGDRLHIGYLGHDGFKAEQLGYWQVDRGVFELVAPRADVTDILEERTEYPRPATAPRPVTALQPTVAPPRVTAPHPVLPPPASGPATPGPASYPGLGRPDSAGYPSPVASPDPAGYQGSGSYRSPAGPELPQRPERQSGQYTAPTGEPQPGRARQSGQFPVAAAYLPVPDSSTGVALPAPAAAPLPLEAEALRAASASRRPQAPQRIPAVLAPAPTAASPAEAPPQNAAGSPAAAGAPVSPGLAAAPVAAGAPMPPVAAGQAMTPAPARRSRGARRRMATERLFADLATLAGIPADSYAVGEAVDGALCLVQTEHGFEVFHSAGDARHELQVFVSEEAACFYLFGVLAAEAVRNGSLARIPVPAGLGPGQPQTS